MPSLFEKFRNYDSEMKLKSTIKYLYHKYDMLYYDITVIRTKSVGYL